MNAMNMSSSRRSSASVHGPTQVDEQLEADLAKASAEDLKWADYIHTTTRQQIRSDFAQYEKDGSITGEDLHTIIGHLVEMRDFEGLFHQSGLILSIVSKKTHTDALLTYHECLSLIGKALYQEREKHYTSGPAVVGEVQTKYLSTSAYLKHVFSCKKAKKNQIVRWQGLPPVDPKTSLLVIVVSMCLLLALCIVGFLTWMYVDGIYQLTEESQDVDLAAVARLTQQLMPASKAAAKSQLDASCKNLAATVKHSFDIAAEGLNDVQQQVALQLTTNLQEEELRLQREAQETIDSALSSVYLMYKTVDLSSSQLWAALSRVVSSLNNGGDGFVVALTASRTTPLHQPTPWETACATCALSMKCAQRLHDIGLHPGHSTVGVETDPLGVTVMTTSMKFTDSLGICMTSPVDGLRPGLASSMLELWYRIGANLGKLGLSTSDGVEIARRPRGGTGGFTTFPTSPRLSAIMQQAIASPRGTNKLWNLRSNSSIISSGAFSKVTLRATGDEWIFLVRKDSTFFIGDIISSLKAQLRQFTVENVEIKIAIRDGENHIVNGEPRPRDVELSPHVILGLSGYSGAMYSTNANGSEVLAGYIAVEGYGAAVLIELNMDVAGDIVTGMLDTALSGANARYHRGHGLYLLHRNSSGDIAYLIPHSKVNDPVPELLVECFARDQVLSFGLAANVAAKCLHFHPPGYVVVAHRDPGEVETELLNTVGYGLGIGAAAALLSLIVTRLLTRNVLDHIEKDYVKYKMQIEEEKRQFSELVKDVMPQFISERIMKGEKLIADSYSQFTFLFSDIIGFTDRTKSMSTVEMVRLLGYTFMLEDGVAEYYGVHKLKTIGDGYFAVTGHERSQELLSASINHNVNPDDAMTAVEEATQNAEAEDKQSRIQNQNFSTALATGVSDPKKEDQIFRMVAFAVVTQQLLSNNFVHFPERTDCFLQSAGSDLGALKLLGMKMGIHTGPCIAGVVDVGRAPHFDCFGPSVNIASRMESTAPTDRIQLSGVAASLLNAKPQYQGLMEFEAPKRTLVKGYGTMTTFIVRATTLQVPEDIINRLHIDRAVKRQHFGESGLQIGDMVGTTSISQSQTSSSVASHSELGSQMSSDEKQVHGKKPSFTGKSDTSGGGGGGGDWQALAPETAAPVHQQAAPVQVEEEHVIPVMAPPTLPPVLGAIPPPPPRF